QAEDGIRDKLVTGVQTCALPISADHAIEPAQEFCRAVHAAAQLADEFPDALITFGIRPTEPATGYGYIHRGEPAAERQGVNAFRSEERRVGKGWSSRGWRAVDNE